MKSDLELGGGGGNTTVINEISNFYNEVTESTGFTDPTAVDMSFDNGTRTFTIAPVLDSFIFWAFGTRYEKNTSESIQINDVDGLWYIYYDISGALGASQDIWNLSTQIPVASILWDSGGGTGTVDETPTNSKPTKFENIYIIAGSTGTLADGQLILLHPLVGSEVVELPKRLPYSRAVCEVAASTEATFDIQISQNGGAFSSAGSLVFAAGAFVGTFTWNSKTILNGSQSDMLKIVAPATADATLANVGISIRGIRT